MILAAALALLAAQASPTPLDEARAAFAAADYARAERLALSAGSPIPPAALYLAGLARFRDGRPAEALEALDRARDGADREGAWHFNRAACLDELGRHGEAEAEYLAAASDPDLATVALVNAGFAALDAGQEARARALAARARKGAAGPGAALVDELEAQLDGAPAGAAAAGAATGPAAAARAPDSWTLGARVEGGWDSDALQSSAGGPERFGATAHAASAFAGASGWVAGRLPLGAATAEASYALAQLAYLAPAAGDRSVQQHDLSALLHLAPLPSLRLELGLAGQLALAGLDAFRGLQAAGGLRGAASLDLGAPGTARLGLGWTRKAGLRDEFRYLDGDRLEAELGHELRWARLTLRGGYRFQLERIGAVSASSHLPPGGPCPVGCTALTVEPLAYAAHAGWLAARLEARPWLRLELGGGLERRGYLDDESTRLTQPDATTRVIGLRRRTDWRWSTSAAATASLGSGLALSLRHDWLASRSSSTAEARPGGHCPLFAPECRGSGAASAAWDKQVLSLGVSGSW